MADGGPPLLGCEGVRFPSRAGKVGLKNLGNTCFMNAGLQCLAHVEPLAVFFLSGKFEEEVNTSNPMGNGGELARAFAELQRMLWISDAASQDPRSARRKLARLAPHLFEGYEQQDVQEFLAFCLDGLHEDLNRVATVPPPPTEQDEKEFERLAITRGEEFAAALAWMRYLERGKSFLVDLMQGQLRSTLICKKCGFKSRRFEAFLYLSLPVARTGMTSVSDALEKYLEEEVLEGNEQWFCEKCKKKVDAKKKIDLWKLPPVLVLHLKRFEFDNRSLRFKKIDTKLTAPPVLDLSEYCSSPQREAALYDVVAVANHIGPYGSGHYTATCRVGDSEGGAWYYFDDERVTPLPRSQETVSKEAYVMFLTRLTPNDAGGTATSTPAEPTVSRSPDRGGVLVRRQTVTMPELWPHWVSKKNSVVADLLAGLPGAGRTTSVTSSAVAAGAASGPASASATLSTASASSTAPAPAVSSLRSHLQTAGDASVSSASVASAGAGGGASAGLSIGRPVPSAGRGGGSVTPVSPTQTKPLGTATPTGAATPPTLRRPPSGVRVTGPPPPPNSSGGMGGLRQGATAATSTRHARVVPPPSAGGGVQAKPGLGVGVGAGSSGHGHGVLPSRKLPTF